MKLFGWTLKKVNRFREIYGWKKGVKDLAEDQMIYRLLFGIVKLAVFASGLNAEMNQVKEIIGHLLSYVALGTGNMMYVYAVMIPCFIVYIGMGLFIVLSNDVGEIIYHTYKKRFK